MGGGGPDPYDDILATCQHLSAIQPVTIEPTPLQTVVLGTFDAQTATFTWDSGIRSKDRIVTDVEIGSNGKPFKVTYTVTDYYFYSIAVSVQLVVNLVNNISGTTFTAGGQTAFAPPNLNIVSVQAPFSGKVDFVLTSGNHSAGDTVNADRSRFSNFSGSLQQPGCVVVPALPIAIVYQPPTKTGQGVFDSAHSVGVSITNISYSYTDGSSSTPSSISDTTAASTALQQLAKIAGTTGNAYATAIGLILSAIASFLQSPSGSGASGVVGMEVTEASTLTLTFTQETRFKSLPELGPGAGDVIVYLQDATFAVYGINGNYTFVPLGFRGLIPTPVPAASLQPGAAQPADLPDALRAQLLALDPVASGNPDGVTDTSRYSKVGEFTLAFPISVTYGWRFTKEVSTAGPKLITQMNSSGQVVGVILGASRGTSQSKTIEASLDVTGPVDFEIWYDQLFDTFAYRDLSPMQSSAVSFEGTLPPSDLPLLGQEVTVMQNGLSVTTLTDAQGHYLVRSPSLQSGSAQLLLPTSGGSPITQAINLSV